jgi:S-DNA-T family DNA segregation ATPase FtsK/SpoIIIE
LFNSSLEQVLSIAWQFTKSGKRYVLADKRLAIDGKLSSPLKLPGRKDIKMGGLTDEASRKTDFVVKGNPKLQQAPQPKQELESKLVTNLPGEDKLWKYPPMNLLTESQSGKADRGDIKGNAAIIEQTLESFGITARVVEVNMGPAVTQYGFEVALGTKLSKITALERDLARALESPTGAIRLEAPIPGRSLVGIELPNKSPEFVPLRKVMTSDAMHSQTSKLAVGLGLDVAGEPVIANIGKMPHVLIAGQTGSGKSVAINTFLASLLFRASPSEVKLILVDPKRVELTGYNDIPHLLTPVIVQPDKVISALRWVISEMDRRYKLFAEAGVRNLEGYNELSGFQALPYIIVFIDELADIMLFAPAEVEDSITKIAQMSRATGIHMVLATQRPSVDVITGLIKANIPSRIAFAVASQIDSRVILDGKGAEKLLGKGDMLYLAPDQAKPVRIQGAYVSDKEINALVAFLKGQGITPHYTEEVVTMGKPGVTTVPGVDGATDDLFRQAVEVVCQYDKASASLLQRRLSIGYARAARIIDQLESAGVVGPQPDGSKPREVLVQSVEQVFANSSSESA